MQLTITPLADAGVEVLPPDIVWRRADGSRARDGEMGVYGDFALSKRREDGPVGGLVGRDPLRTAVIMLLFTDARADVGQITWAEAGDRRGWVGDGFDVNTTGDEAPLGSLLWLFRRRELTRKTAAEVKDEATRALQPLLAQGAVARIDVTAEAFDIGPTGRIDLTVNLYGRDGTVSYAAKFDLLWKSPHGV